MNAHPTRTNLTVGRLRELLAAFEDDTPVLVDGYEDGYDDPGALRLVEVVGEPRKPSDQFWTGAYQDADSWRKGERFTALVIPR